MVKKADGVSLIENKSIKSKNDINEILSDL